MASALAQIRTPRLLLEAHGSTWITFMNDKLSTDLARTAEQERGGVSDRARQN
jgi:hypothetical protein